MIAVFSRPNCPKCMILKSRLETEDREFKTSDDAEHMASLGIMSVPMMQVDDGDLMDFNSAMAWLNNNEKLEV